MLSNSVFQWTSGFWKVSLRHSLLLHQRHFCEEVKSKGFVLCPGPSSSLQDMERPSTLLHTSDSSPYVSAYYWNKRHGQYCKALAVSSIISQLLFLDSLMFRPFWKHLLYKLKFADLLLLKFSYSIFLFIFRKMNCFSFAITLNIAGSHPAT